MYNYKNDKNNIYILTCRRHPKELPKINKSLAKLINMKTMKLRGYPRFRTQHQRLYYLKETIIRIKKI